MVTSTLGEGSRFTLELPATPAGTIARNGSEAEATDEMARPPRRDAAESEL